MFRPRLQDRLADQGPSTAEARDLLAIAEAADEAKRAQQIRRDAALAIQLQAQYDVAQQPMPAAGAHLPQHQEAPVGEFPHAAVQSHSHAALEPDSSSTEVCQKPGDCSICMERKSNATFSCGHICFCVQCSVGLHKCPLCRKEGDAFQVWM